MSALYSSTPQMSRAANLRSKKGWNWTKTKKKLQGLLWDICGTKLIMSIIQYTCISLKINNNQIMVNYKDTVHVSGSLYVWVGSVGKEEKHSAVSGLML